MAAPPFTLFFFYLLLHFNSLNCLFTHSPCFASLVVALISARAVAQSWWNAVHVVWVSPRNTWGVTAAVVGIAGWNFLAWFLHPWPLRDADHYLLPRSQVFVVIHCTEAFGPLLCFWFFENFCLCTQSVVFVNLLRGLKGKFNYYLRDNLKCILLGFHWNKISDLLK